VKYVNFARPRNPIIELIGEENQSCPVLILDNGTFINDPEKIINHLIEFHKIGRQH
jgi:hypothetical protein